MKNKLTGFKDKNGKEICFNSMVTWDRDILIEVKSDFAVGTIVNSPDNQCVMVIWFPMNEKWAKGLTVVDEKDLDKYKDIKNEK